MKNFEPNLDRDASTRISPLRLTAGHYRQGAMLLVLAVLVSGCGGPIPRDKAVKEIKKLGCEADATDVRLTVIANDTFSDANLDKLPELATLQDSEKEYYFKEVSLDLKGSKVTDESLANLEPMKNLTDLKLQGTKITDAGLKHLEVLTALEYLIVPNTIGDVAIEELKKAKLPKELDVVKKAYEP